MADWMAIHDGNVVSPPIPILCSESFESRDVIDPSLVENTLSDNSSTKIRKIKLKLKKPEYIISKNQYYKAKR